jgi:hypothetical protein
VIDLLVVEWEASKDPTIVWTGGCLAACELPIRYGLPCRHWMSKAVECGYALPLSLIHPRWWLEGPAIVPDSWVMGYYDTHLQPRPEFLDQYQDRGRHMVVDSALATLEMQQTLPTEAAERIGDLMKRSAQQIMANEQAIIDREAEIPTRLPLPVAETRPAAFIPPRRSTRRRGLIGLEVSEKKARAREKVAAKENKPQQMPTRVRKKQQRLAAEIVDKQETQDFIILTPST